MYSLLDYKNGSCFQSYALFRFSQLPHYPDLNMDKLEAVIRQALAADPSGVTEEDMKCKGFRLITPKEYMEALKLNETNPSK